MKRKYILVINNDKDFSNLIVDYLAEEGFGAITAENGDIAFKYIGRKKPDLILLDIQMHSENGLDVCRVLKARPSTSDIPVIVFSTNSSRSDMLSGYLAGADRYIGRPFILGELGECVHGVLRTQSSSA